MNDNIRRSGNLPTNYHAGNEKKRGYPIVQIVKRIKWGRIAVLFFLIFGIFRVISCAIDSDAAVESIEETTPPETVEYIFRDDDGTPVDMQDMTNAWAAEVEYTKRYELTDAERWEVASVVTAEAKGEPFAGKVAVAQCILQACEDDGIRPCEAVAKYKYTKNRPEPTEEVLEAVQAVFDFGQVATSEPIKYFYAPALVYSEFHESQDYVMTINGHRFFKEAE